MIGQKTWHTNRTPTALPEIVRTRLAHATLAQEAKLSLDKVTVNSGYCSSLGVARGGVEPPTFRFSVGRSYQLSYLAE